MPAVLPATLRRGLNDARRRREIHPTMRDIIHARGEYDSTSVDLVDVCELLKTRKHSQDSCQRTRSTRSLLSLTHKSSTILHPTSQFRAVWDLLSMFLLLYTAIVVVGDIEPNANYR